MQTATKHPVNVPSSPCELAVVLRHLGGVQTQVSDLVREQQQQIAQLQTQLIRLRAQRMLERTQSLWGLSVCHPTMPTAMASKSVAIGASALASLTAKAWQAAQKIICLTGCVGHAHPWLKPNGQCARTGQECDVQEMPRCA